MVTGLIELWGEEKEHLSSCSVEKWDWKPWVGGEAESTSPQGPLLQLHFLPQFPHLSKRKQSFPGCLRRCGRTALTNWSVGKKCGKGQKGHERGLKTSGDKFIHLFPVSMRGGVRLRKGECWAMFSLERLWNIPGATAHPLNCIRSYFYLDDMSNHESRGMNYLTYGRPFSDHDSGMQISAAGHCSGDWRQCIITERHVPLPARSAGMVPLISGQACCSGGSLFYLSNYCLLSYSAVSSFPMMLLTLSLKRAFSLLDLASSNQGGCGPSPLPQRKSRHRPTTM